MADNNLARSRNDLPDFFADDDPLAELARIVGYDDLPVAARPGSSSTDTSSPVRHEPAFNLEDELLQEFERYDAPRLDPIHDIALDDGPQPFAEPAPDVRATALPLEPEELEFVPEAAAVEPSPAFLPADDEIRERDDLQFGDEEAPLAVDTVYESVAVEPAFEPAPEAARVEPVFDLPDFPAAGAMSSVAPVEEEPAEEFDLAAELESSIAAEPVAASQPEVTFEPEAKFEPEAQIEPEVKFEPQVEFETQPVFEPEAAFEPEAKSEPEAKFELEAKAERGKGAYIPGFRMPLTNFSVARDLAAASAPAPELAAQPVASAPTEYAFELPVVDDIPTPKPDPAPAAELQVSVTSSEAQAPEQQRDAPVAATPAMPVASTAPSAAAPQKDRFSALDELIYDVQRYSLPTSVGQPLATPVAKAPEPPIAPAAAPVAPAASIIAKAPVAAPPAAALDEKDPFSDEEFELALDGLELDLADIIVEEAQKHPVQATLPAVAAVKTEAAPAVASALAPTVHVASIAAAAAAPVVEAQGVGEPESIADLPFDPAQIADSEDQVEAIAELDVPSLPAEEPEQPPAYRPDYELDIDAELATLLATPNKPASAPARKPEIDIAPRGQQAAAEAGRSPNYTDLDDFERALEEDFRRSLTTPLPAAEHEELHYSDADYVATVENARRSVRSWAVPLALAGVVILGGVGAYAFFGSSVSNVVSGGEPVIIAADNDPIKIAPQNPGGKTVPNQDKAVYDRVAGVSPKDPKQRTLISSNEEPIDVVQKTLMPDTLPLEGENDIDPTDVGETQDPRLLPQDRAAPGNASAEQQPVTVMPRKVKTMIVRPDGKLVEQEIAAPALAAPETAKLPAAGAKPVETAAAFPDKAPASVPATPTRTQPLAAPSNAGSAGVLPVSAPANPAAPAEHVNVVRANPVTPPVAAAPAQPTPAAAAPAPAAVQAPAPVAPVQASAPAAKAPVPIARPSEQPVNVVAAVTDQGNVRAPGQQTAGVPASAPNQVASLGSGDYVIQIASLPSQAEAQKSYQSLSAKFGSVIGGRGVDIKSAEIAGKGTFYRVRIPAGSKNDAVALCERYRAAGGTCLVGR
ncbi:Sporulation domain-containing protein [Rhizobium sp. CF080]|uniref:SPOR domain-containing protein n=1 Tax=Rhizobium sp. (strain CF080) TaxID=1144310 RepID=UPI0003E806DB|nr:SPOR domain-containing protein [Rhizobium sp. CF080]EUB95971.1 Sporulation domain-containing protein [Rhizobium sp. CF080]